MARIMAVTGQAGTGKTTWLMEKANELAPRLLTAKHHSMLAITRMHGSRRRLVATLRDSCPSIPSSVSTIDGFALSVLNRWRTTLGHSKPIQPVSDNVCFAESVFGVEAGFGHIMKATTPLMATDTVKAVLRESYPLVMIDEFQDCHGPLLDFVKAVAACSSLLVAADDFQLLARDVDGCPAVEWIRSLVLRSAAECDELIDCHRTSARRILEAAHCLRANVKAPSKTVPVICCPNQYPAAFKIIQALVYSRRNWHGTTALICPSHDPFVGKVLDSLKTQLSKRSLHPLSWFHESSMPQEGARLRKSLGLPDRMGEGGWSAPSVTLDPLAAEVVARSERFARLRGLGVIPSAVVTRYVDTVVHERRAYCSHSPKRIFTTVHGAKNREFDDVIILWPYKVPSDTEQKRRLLYNAITRAKTNCMVLVLGNMQRATNDPVLSLLGPAEDAFPKDDPKKRKTRKGAKKTRKA